ncbi:hypothetical protein ANCCEY_07530 [Ancylostoma ceylanicum]|uniref:Uncharacterized protein n=1 Tax=Ancylostoma ceylanicum TaxID=53326 RepID=A0A0D6LMS0_9BILA|nr:hypothetical protein ANCCEY_07530 [Ancylostoma ceylanicum]
MGMWPMDWEMDHDSLISAGSALQKLRMYPYFDVAHYLLASLVWYGVFYSPFDIVHKLISFKLIKVVVSIAKEVQRTHKISHGVAYAAKLYPESYMVQVLVGVAKGAGSGVVKIVEQLVRGTWVPSQHEMLRPSFTTKACVVAALVFTLERNSMYVTAPHDLVYLRALLLCRAVDATREEANAGKKKIEDDLVDDKKWKKNDKKNK